jgi:hypothetical protein
LRMHLPERFCFLFLLDLGHTLELDALPGSGSSSFTNLRTLSALDARRVITNC